MTDFLDRIGKLSPKRLALLALEQHEQLEAMREPLAIVGMACRFPGGADSPEGFWQLLKEGRDAIRDVPAQRWDIDAWYDPDPDAPGRIAARNGGFLDDVAGFDNTFFGISPREALTMDPQQRLLLETCWHALEHAGIAPERLAGSATGVFVGICNADHFQRVLGQGVEQIDAYIASGNAHSVAAGRISYCLGLQGPALSIDTACSSSLVALHEACRSLRSGESSLVLAAGVNLMCAPETSVALSRAHMLAPDGRCKTFDASADGFSRGEGCGVLVLKRLADARRDQDRILALVRGSAINQDGRSGGLTVPNGPAQEAVIRAALADGGLRAEDIDYVEAHGTGTSLGDPIEVRALAGALGAGRTAADPLWVGSVKTNIGHLESAAGVAGVMKVVLALQHEQIPPHLHFTTPSPHIDWNAHPVRVAPQGRAWPQGERVRRAGVSSFGFSGTNAHVVLEQAPAAEPAATELPAARGPVVLPLSARSEAALARGAGELAAAALASRPALADLARTLGAGRSHLGERAAVVAADLDTTVAALQALSRGEAHAALQRGTALAGQAPELVFLFTGQGSQYSGMARALYDAEPVFRALIDHCDERLGADAAGRRLKQVMWSGEGDSAPVHETAWTQPALFAVEYGIAQLWRSWGVEPAAVIGHSVGEYVAACVAGVFSLDDGLALIAERGRLMQALPPGGAMAALFAPVAEIEQALVPFGERVSIAAVNAADSVVVSGEAEAVAALLAALERRDVRGHLLHIALAAHSPQVAPALAAMEAAAARVPMSPPRIPVAWNVTGGEPLPGGGAPDAAYWRRHLREPVQFARGLESLQAQGFRHFLEVGPHPTLVALAQRTITQDDVRFVGSLRRGKDDLPELAGALGALYTAGVHIDWNGVHGALGGRPVALPGYCFEQRPFWLPLQPPRAWSSAPHRRGDPLQLQRLPTAVPLFETLLSPTAPAYLAEHRVHGQVLVPGPVLLALAQDAARQAGGEALRNISGFEVDAALVLPEPGRCVQLHLAPQADGAWQFEVHSRAAEADSEGRDAWRRHAAGRLLSSAPGVEPRVDLPALQRRLGGAVSGQAYYARLQALGVELGPVLRSVHEAHCAEGEVLARLALDDSLAREAAAWAHPVLVDGALQAVGLAVPPAGDGEVFLLGAIDTLALARPLPAALWCHVRLRPTDLARPAQWQADARLLGDDGELLGRIDGIQLRRASRQALRAAVEAPPAEAGAVPELHYELLWQPSPATPAATAALAAPTSVEPALRERFAALAQQHHLAVYDELLPELDQLSVDHVRLALQRLGFEARPGTVVRTAALADALKVQPQHRRLFARLLRMLAEDGWLHPRTGEDDAFEVVRDAPVADPSARYEALLARFGTVDGELRTLRRCGSELARVLDGTQDPIALLFPDGSLSEARQLYVESPYARTYNTALAEALQRAIAALPEGARLRILEIGAGTGGTTTYVLPRLPAGRVDYRFTDLSPLFLDRAAEQFAAYPFVRYSLLDIEREPAAQGFAAGSFDIVIAANVLHATADLAQAVRHAQALLAPGGQLFLLEGVAPERWVDLSFGLTDGWWRFTDAALRPDYPLIDRAAWHALLTDCGFDEVLAVPAADGSRGGAQQALLVARARRRPRRLTIVGDAGGLAAELARRLRERGDEVRLRAAVPAAPDPSHAGDWLYLGAIAAPAGGDLAAVCEEQAAQQPLALMNALAGSAGSGRLWLASRGVQPVGGAPAPEARWQAPLWGLGRGMALEQPAHWGALVDLDPADALPAQVAQLLASLDDHADAEDQIAWRGGVRHVARLLPMTAPAAAPPPLRSDATYLVTGGFGGLGLLVGRWLAEHGARHVALLGRRPDPSLPGVRAIEAAGAIVHIVAADIADEAAVARALDALAAQAPPLRGVMHAAADFSGAPLGRLTPAQMSAMLRPKLQGSLVLERLTCGAPLDFTVLFSSTTALLGASELAHYAAANAFLDASAALLDRPSRRVLSINWGTWEAMRLASASEQRGYHESGLEPMPAARALDAIGGLLAQPRAQAVVAQIDWSVLKPLHEARRARPLLAALDAAPRKAAAPAGTMPALAARLAALDEQQRREALIQFVQAEVAAVLGQDSAAATPLDTGLFDLGMDSLMSVELRRRLERGAACRLPSTLTFNYPNVRALAGFLARELKLESAPATPPSAPAAAPAVVPAGPAEGGLDALSDEELEARLLARLEQAR